MLVGGGSSTGNNAEARAAEAARRAAEAARARAEAARKQAEQRAEQAAKRAERATAQPDADTTQKAVTPRGTSVLKLEKAIATPEKLAETALKEPAVAVEAAAENPGKFTDTLIKGLGVLAGGFVGNEAFQLLKGSLSVKNKVGQIKDLTQKITDAKAESATLAGATGTALRDAAKDAVKAPEVKGLDKLGKVNAGLSIATGVNSALNLRNSVAALKDGATVQELTTVAGDAFGALRGADEAVKLVKGVNVGFLAGKVNPLVSIAASGADSIKRVDNLTRNWDTLSTKEKVANFAALGGNVTDIVGSGLIATGVGAPIGVALKGVGAGLSLVSLGIQNFDTLKSGAGKVSHFVGDRADDVADAAQDVGSAVASGAKKVASALNPFD